MSITSLPGYPTINDDGMYKKPYVSKSTESKNTLSWKVPGISLGDLIAGDNFSSVANQHRNTLFHNLETYFRTNDVLISHSVNDQSSSKFFISYKGCSARIDLRTKHNSIGYTYSFTNSGDHPYKSNLKTILQSFSPSGL